jgi:hypothetical protein
VHKNINIGGLTYAEASSSAGASMLCPSEPAPSPPLAIEPYDEALNRQVFNYQDRVSDAIVVHTAERKAFPQRRLNEVRANLAAGRPRPPDSTPLPTPTLTHGARGLLRAGLALMSDT